MKLIGLEKNGTQEQALLNMMVILPGAEDLDEKGVKKDGKTLHRQRRGMAAEEQAKYNRRLTLDDERYHRETLAIKGVYVNHKPKPNAPSYNPFMTARATGTTKTAIV